MEESRQATTAGIGPVKNKPIQLADGAILCGSSTEHEGWRVHFEMTSDLGSTWSRTQPINDGVAISAIQPSILTHPGGEGYRRWAEAGRAGSGRHGRLTRAIPGVK